MTEPDQPEVVDELRDDDAHELPPGFHEPEPEWSTEQRPGFIESTLPQD